MKTINVTLDDSTWQEAQKLAAARDTTVDALLGEQMQTLTKQQARREKARHEILAMIGTFDCEIGRMPTREERNARG